MLKNVVIVAGEASGDAHAARLITELKKLDKTISVRGMGGDNLRKAGVDIFIDMAELAVVGIVEVLMKYNLIKAELNKLKQDITTNRPDLLILVDYQEFNQRLAAYAKSIGIKVLFYIGPQVWAWRPKRVYKMARIVDHMAVILPFEKTLYKDADVAVTFTGHPLTDEVIRDKSPQQARQQLQIDERTTIGLFPGSRSGEIKRVLPILLESAQLVKMAKPQIQFILPVASTINQEDLVPFKSSFDALSIITIDNRFINNRFYDVIQSCDIILTASGTATLEIGLLEVPMVIVYKVAALSHFILKFFVSIKHLGLVNIIPGKEVVKEFIQQDARPTDIAQETLRLLDDKVYYQSMKNELAKIRQQLRGSAGDEDSIKSSSNGSLNVARLAYDMLNNQ
jgi:lipid-A-disaccharide synthase